MKLSDILESEVKKLHILYSPCTYSGRCVGSNYGSDCTPDDLENCAYFVLFCRLYNESRIVHEESRKKIIVEDW